MADLGAIFNFFIDAAVAIQADGRILVAGNNGVGAAEVVRLLPDGTVDPSYGKAGVVFVSQFSLFNLRIQPDGDAVGAGLSAVDDPLPAALFRLTF